MYYEKYDYRVPIHSRRAMQRKNMYNNMGNKQENGMTRNAMGGLIVNENSQESAPHDFYFRSYERLGIHQEMLLDQVRTLSFRDAICNNEHLFREKVVMDVGCGCGILSLFAAQAGAKMVIGVDSANIIDIAQEIVLKNGEELAQKIVLIKSRLEDITELPNGIETVDIIISEWMGYCLLYESMLDTVIYARDRWLKPNGFIFPDKCTMFLAGMEARAYRDHLLTSCHNVHGFNFSPIRKTLDQGALIQYVDPQKIVTDDQVIKVFNLYTIKKEDLSFEVPFVLTAARDDEMQALVTFFSVEFTKCHTKVGFSKFYFFFSYFFKIL